MFRLHSDMRAKGLSSVRPTPELFCGVSDRHPCRLYAMHYMRKVLLLPLELLWCMVRYISSACPTTGKKKNSRRRELQLSACCNFAVEEQSRRLRLYFTTPQSALFQCVPGPPPPLVRSSHSYTHCAPQWRRSTPRLLPL